MSWKLALQYARQRIVDELLPLAGRRPIDLTLIRSAGGKDFDELFDAAMRPTLTAHVKRQHRLQLISVATLSITSRPPSQRNPAGFVQTIASRTLIPEQDMSELDAAGWARENELRRAFLACLKELDDAFCGLPYRQNWEAIESTFAPPLQLGSPRSLCWRDCPWTHWLFCQALQQGAKRPVFAIRQFVGLSQQAQTAFILRRVVPKSSWFAIIPNAVRASLFLIDLMLDDASAPEQQHASEPVAPLQFTPIASAANRIATPDWPPDDGWHFDHGRAAFRRTIFAIKGKNRVLLAMLVNAAQSSRPGVSRKAIQSAWERETGRATEPESVKGDISKLRRLLKLHFQWKEDPIPVLDSGEECAWRLDDSTITPRCVRGSGQ